MTTGESGGVAQGGDMGEVICPLCGTRNPTGSNFCNRCGTALGAETAPPRDPAAPLAHTEAIDATLGEPPSTQISAEPVFSGAGTQGVVEEVDEPTLDALISAYQPPVQPPSQLPEPVVFPDEQLLGSTLGYLELVSVAGEMPNPPPEPGLPTGENEHWRTVRALVREEPLLATAGTSGSTVRINYRLVWAALLLIGAAVLGMNLAPNFLPGAPQEMAGASAAWAAVNALEVDDEVLVVWMADPATAGEVSLVALPVVSHLLEREARSLVVGTRPASLAMARRVYAEAVAGLDESAMRSVVQNWMGSGRYLPGGEAALAFAASEPERSLSYVPTQLPEPRLVLVVASSPDDVQQWLEVGWPRLRLPTVAVTPASGDPMLRPYAQSGQLKGLVAGYDGAITFQSHRDDALSQRATQQTLRTAAAQNWGALAVLLTLIAGNLFTFFGRSRRA